MSLDISSFSIGVAIGSGIGALIHGFFRKMGEDAYAFAKQILSQEQKFVAVDRRYEPDTLDGASLSWVSEAKLYEYKNLGFKFRIIDDQNQGWKEPPLIPAAKQIYDELNSVIGLLR